jgi:predicted nucleic acid-binding protein
MISWDREIFDLATQIRAKHGTKTPDALHLAVAVVAQCEEFWTNDHRLTAAARGRIGIRVVG